MPTIGQFIFLSLLSLGGVTAMAILWLHDRRLLAEHERNLRQYLWDYEQDLISRGPHGKPVFPQVIIRCRDGHVADDMNSYRYGILALDRKYPWSQRKD